MDEEEAKKELQKGLNQAEEILEDQDKLEDFLRKIEAKLGEIPVAGKQLSMVPVLVSLLKSYFKKEYNDVVITGKRVTDGERKGTYSVSKTSKYNDLEKVMKGDVNNE